MLVLTRKQNEKICIGSSIVITIVKLKGKAVRLGIEAPNDVNILRGELLFEVADNDVQSKKATKELVGEGITAGQPSDSKPAKSSSARTHRDQTNHWPAKKRAERMSSKPVAPVEMSLGHPSASTFSSPTI